MVWIQGFGVIETLYTNNYNRPRSTPQEIVSG